jgi:transposase
MSKSSSKTPEIIELTSEELDSLFKRLGDSNLSDHDKRLFKGVMQTYIWMKHKYETGKLGLHKLATILFGKKSEKRHKPEKDKDEESADESPEGKDQGKEGADSPNSPSSPLPQGKEASRQKPKGHGRFGADAYTDAETVTVEHPTLKPGDPCPESCGGKLYSIEPGIVVRVTGQDIAKATRYHIQKLRCNTCGLVVKPVLPAETGDRKYSCRFKSILAVQKYFMGVPFFRQEGFQKLLAFPLPDSTQWDLIEQVADSVHPCFWGFGKTSCLGQNCL